MIEARDAHEGTDDIVVLAIPLLKALHRETVRLDVVVVVDCPTDVALDRLLGQRGFDRADAEARIRSQISREERCEEADFILDNSGDRAALEVKVAGSGTGCRRKPPGNRPARAPTPGAPHGPGSGGSRSAVPDRVVGTVWSAWCGRHGVVGEAEGRCRSAILAL